MPRRLPLTVTVVVLWGVGWLVLQLLSAGDEDEVLAFASTSLVNLARVPGLVLVLSGLLVVGGPYVDWVLLALIGVGGVEWRFGWWRTLAAVGGAHAIATLLSEGLVGVRISTGALPASYTRLVDVGPSYLVVAGLAACVVAGPRWWWRAAAAASLVVSAPDLLGGLTSLDLSATGHLASFVLGALAALLLVADERRRRRSAGPERAVVASARSVRA